jgi:phage terminase small subunit
MRTRHFSTGDLNERQSRFCDAYVRRPVGRYAALEAGYSPKGATVQASRLLERPEVRARIDALQADVVGRNCQRVDAILSKLEAIYDGALSSHQFHAAVRAVELQVKLSGMIGGADGLEIEQESETVEPAMITLRPIRPNVNQRIPRLTGNGGEG